MNEKENKSRSIRFDIDLAKKIESLAKESDRDFSKQVHWMLKQYLKIIEQSKQ